MPDGRVQTVTYNVGDAYTGYVANVEYSGSAHHNDAILYTTPRPQKYVKYVEPHRIYTTPKPAEPIYTTPKPVEKIAPVEKIEHKQYGPVFREHFAKKTNYY